MNLHSLARSHPARRELLVRRISDEGWQVDDAARAAGVSTRTAYKWLSRFRSDGISGLRDRSSRPLRMARLTASEWQLQVITLRREHRMTSRAIARQLRRPRSTVCRILRRAGISRLRDLDPRRDEGLSIADQRQAEGFIQTLQRGRGYARPYDSSAQRREVLRPWLRHYNRRRPHGSLDGEAPFAKLRRLG